MIEDFLKTKKINFPFNILFNPDNRFLSSPFNYESMLEAIKFLKEKKEMEERAFIVGHEDMDGMASSIIVSALLKEINLPYDVYIPSKEAQPHGLSKFIIDKCLEEYFSFIIAVDCGLSDIKEIKYGQENGLDFLILDHHSYTGAKNLPFIFLHPQNGTGFPYLSASSLSLFLFLAYCYQQGRDLEYVYERYPDLFILASCGVLADRVPFLADNMTVVNLANEILKEKRGDLYNVYVQTTGKEPVLWNFVSIFSSLSSIKGKPLLFYLWEEKELSFKKEYMARIIEEEKISSRLSKESLFEAKNSLIIEKDYTLIITEKIRLKNIGWIANVVKRKYGLPCIVISKRKDNVWVGEGRSYPGFSLYEVFLSMQDIFIDFGGHLNACGFSIKEDNLKIFQERLDKSIEEMKKKNIKQRADIILKGNDTETLLKLIKLGKHHIYTSCYIEGFSPNNIDEDIRKQIRNLPEQDGIYNLLLSIEDKEIRAFI